MVFLFIVFILFLTIFFRAVFLECAFRIPFLFFFLYFYFLSYGNQAIEAINWYFKLFIQINLHFLVHFDLRYEFNYAWVIIGICISG